MKRKYVNEITAYIAQNIKILTHLKIAGMKPYAPTLLTAIHKFQMCIQVKYLNHLFSWFIENNFQNLAEENTSDRLENIYNLTLEEYFNFKPIFYLYSFNDFWSELIEERNIHGESADKYYYGKIQAYILWQAMNILYGNGKASDTGYYTLSPDRLIDNLPEQTCVNSLLTRALGLMTSNEYIPVFPAWKDSKKAARIKPNVNPRGLLKDNLPCKGFSGLGNKTLADVWLDYTTLEKIIKDAPIKPILFFQIENDLAQALAELTERFLYIIEILGGDLDFYKEKWEDGDLTESEKASLIICKVKLEELTEQMFSQQKTIESQQKTVELLAQTNKKLSHSNDLYASKDWENETVYSQNKAERLREQRGEMLKDSPIIMPNRKQKSEHPDCRWIISCTVSSKNRFLGLEKTISIWKEFCENDIELGFWTATTLCSGLYLLIDGKLFKGTEADPELQKKIQNAYSHRSYYKKRAEIGKEIFQNLDDWEN